MRCKSTRFGYLLDLNHLPDRARRADQQAFAATDPATKFRAALTPLQSAAYDERIHTALSVGPSKPPSGDPVVIVTHVDVIPDLYRAGTAKVSALVEEGRIAKGIAGSNIQIQISRKNHFTVVECWDLAAAGECLISTSTAAAFRQELQPMSGALYDERLPGRCADGGLEPVSLDGGKHLRRLCVFVQNWSARPAGVMGGRHQWRMHRRRTGQDRTGHAFSGPRLSGTAYRRR